MKKRLLTIIICFILTVACAASVFAETVDDAKKKKKSLESEKQSVEAMLSDLNSLKNDVNDYVRQLDADLKDLEDEISRLNTEIEKLDGNIADAEEDIAKTEEELAKARQIQAKQYEDMKLRIKYMYERSDTTLLDMIFGSKSILQLLNKGEYVEKISDYDRNQLDVYEQTSEDISEKVKSLEEKKANLEGEREKQNQLKGETEEKQAGVEALIADKKSEMASYENQIGTAEEKLKKYEEEIKQQEATIKAIEAEIKRREEEARKAAEAAGKAYKTVDLGDIHFSWPCSASGRITSYFGDRDAPVEGASTSHKGIDIGASTGSSISAAAGGEVIISSYSPSAGNYVMISHGGGVYTVYMHASELLVSEGEQVSAGQTIAKVGSTGYSSGPHLHFGIRANGSYVNPLAYVSP